MDRYFEVSRDAARSLEEFSDAFRGALVLGDFETWADQWGYLHNTTALKTTFPIPLDAAGYQEFKGDMKYRGLYTRSIQMRSKMWQDGVSEFARIIEADDFIGWMDQPQKMATELLRMPNKLVAAMLAESTFAGPLLDLYRDPDTNTASTRRLFATDHPVNVLDESIGTDIDNTMTTTQAEILSGRFFELVSARFRSFQGPNGEKLGLRMTGGWLLVPGAHEQLFKKALELDTVIRVIKNDGSVNPATPGTAIVDAVAQNNVHKGTIGYTVADELQSDDYFYAMAAGRPGLYPWIVQKGPVEEFRHDKDSHLYKSSMKVAISEVAELNVGACMPHGIIRVQITG